MAVVGPAELIDGMRWRVRTGAPSRDLPSEPNSAGKTTFVLHLNGILNDAAIAGEGPTAELLADEELMRRTRLELPFGFVPRPVS